MKRVLLGCLLVVILLTLLLVFTSNEAGANNINVPAQSPSVLMSPWDGYEKAWLNGTVINEAGYLYVFKDENTPSHFYLKFSERVYVQYEEIGFYFIEKYYPCLETPIYGWIPKEHILLDEDVVYE